MIAALVSGGKDSTATLLLAIEKHGKENVLGLFVDTGFEARQTYQYLNYLERKTGVKIVRLKNPEGYDLISLILEKKLFPNSRMRFCTALLKQVPVILFLKTRKDVKELWVGIRADESRARQARYSMLSPEDTFSYSEWLSGTSIGGGIRKSDIEAVSHVKCRFPIVDWTQEQVFNYLKEKGIEPNPLYKMGHRRVGCYPCILGSLQDYRACWRTEEGRRNILKLLEVEKTLNSQGYNTRLKDHITARKLVKRLELEEDEQIPLFDSPCTICLI